MALIHCHFFSDVLGLSTSMDVILPQGATRQVGMASRTGAGAFPCLYLLHGLSDDHTIWQRRTSIERYVAPLGLAVVMPTVHRSFYTDMKHGLKYWTFISEEVPAVAKSLFRISSRREDTFVAGLSMGGYGAFKLALNRPDDYAAAASLSGCLDLEARIQEGPPTVQEDMRLAFGAGTSIRRTTNDLMTQARRLARLPSRRQPALFQCCGTGDYLYPMNIRFRDHARKLGLKLKYEEGPGSHEWGFWDHWIQRVLEWLPLKGRRS